jgi:outer membrane lipoprotein SlyB
MRTPDTMNSKTLASLAALAVIGCASPNTPQNFGPDESTRGRMAGGTIESVSLVRIERDIHAYEAPSELRIRPQLRDRVVVRLDDGRVLTLVLKASQRFETGERVRVLSHTYDPHGPQVFHE